MIRTVKYTTFTQSARIYESLYASQVSIRHTKCFKVTLHVWFFAAHLCKWHNKNNSYYAPEWDVMCLVNENGTRERCDVPMCHTLPYCDKYKWMQDAREDTSVPASVQACIYPPPASLNLRWSAHCS